MTDGWFYLLGLDDDKYWELIDAYIYTYDRPVNFSKASSDVNVTE